MPIATEMAPPRPIHSRLSTPAAALVLAAVSVLSGCGEKIPPVPVPQTQAVTGVVAPCEGLVWSGFPRKEPESTGTYFVCRDGYVLNWDPVRKTPEWLSLRLTAQQLTDIVVTDPKDEARPDPVLPKSAQTQMNDHVGTGYNRLFLSSPWNMRHDDRMFSHAQYLTTAVPQHTAMMPVWAQLDEQVRAWVASRGELVVVSGVVYMGGVGRGWVGVPDKEKAKGDAARRGRIEVPTHLFKVIFDPKRNQSVGFLIPNDGTTQGGLGQYMVPVSTVESATTLRFAPNMTLEEQSALKTQNIPAHWPITPVQP